MSASYSGNSWIVDSGATDLMMHLSQFFHSYMPSSSDRKIIVAVKEQAVTIANINCRFFIYCVL